MMSNNNRSSSSSSSNRRRRRKYQSFIDYSFNHIDVLKIAATYIFLFVVSNCVGPTYGFFDALDDSNSNNTQQQQQQTGSEFLERPVCNICRDVISLSDLTLGNPGETFAFLNNQVITCQEAQYEGLQFGDRVGYTVDQCATAQALAAADDNRCGCPTTTDSSGGTAPTSAPATTGGTTSPVTTPKDDDSTVFCVLCLSGNEVSKNGFIAGLQCKEVEVAGKNKELTQSECVGAQLLADTISDPCGCRAAGSSPQPPAPTTPSAPVPAPTVVPPTPTVVPTIIPPFGPGPGPTAPVPVPTVPTAPSPISPVPQPTFFPPVTTLSPTFIPSSTPTVEPSESLDPTPM